jgi:hypothetical protein
MAVHNERILDYNGDSPQDVQDKIERLRSKRQPLIMMSPRKAGSCAKEVPRMREQCQPTDLA